MSGYQHYSGRFVLYGSAGGVWSYLCEDITVRFLANNVNLHITSSIDLKAKLCCVITGIVIGVILATIVENKMDKSRKILDTSKYVCKVIIEVLVVLLVIIIGCICLKMNYAKYNDFLYPKE